jgi:branched-chain amino acid transport system substrate-binding protein
MPLNLGAAFLFSSLTPDMDQLPAFNRRALLLAAAAAAVPGAALAERGEPLKLALIEGLSGPFANAGEAVFRNLLWAVERVNRRGGVRESGRQRMLELVRFDSEGQSEKAIALLRAAVDQGIGFVAQGNSSATAAALIEAIDRHNERDPQKRVVLLNYSAVDPILTNERCSPWHFRFDAHADMRLAALVEVIRTEAALRKVYLIGQDYSFGQHVQRQARTLLARRRPDIDIVGDELHPMGRVKDFLPYAAKIQASGAQAVITGNWGNDLTLLVKAMREVGASARFYTFYGNALGAPAAIGEAGVGTVYAVAEWHPNAGGAGSDALYAAFRERFPDPRDDYVHFRMQAMVEMLAEAVERAGSAEPAAVARALSGVRFDARHLGSVHSATMRAADHQLQQPLLVSVMDRAGAPGVRHDVEGSGFGFRTVRRFAPAEIEQPTTCRMNKGA